MTTQLLTYYSNRVELLFHFFKEASFASSSPFTRRLVFVPSPAMKSWLMLQMAQDPNLDIAMGIEMSYPDQLFEKLQSSQRHSLTSLELALAIEIEIRKVFRFWPSLLPYERDLWQPLHDYLKLDVNGSFSRKSERRLVLLSSTLASLFIQYGIYGGPMIAEWDKSSGWQQKLWKLIFEDQQWSYPYRNVMDAITDLKIENIPINTEIHLFALSFLPKISYDYLEHLAKEIPVNIYILSPCQAFWTDMLSDRQSQRLVSFWQKRGAPLAQQQDLETYLRDRNPLLANFGRLGREMAQQLEESDALAIQSYILPGSVTNYLHYDPLLTDEMILDSTTKSLSLLEVVQTDLVLLRNPLSEEKISLPDGDRSIQIHLSTNRMREVQNLYNTLLQIISEQSQQGISVCPKDIVVMAPNISEYVPFIEAVFKADDSVLGVHIMDLSVPAQNPFVQGFLHLLALPFTRWDVLPILQLLDYPAFQRKHNFNGEDIAKIREWIKAADVRWGGDAAHRDALLKRDYCLNGMVEKVALGTWEHAVDRLLTGLAMDTENDVLPLQVDATLSILLGKWIELIRSLRMDLSCLQDGTCLTLEDWTAYLKCLSKTYFEADDKNNEQTLFVHIDAFAKAGNKLGKETFPFNSIKHHLQNTLNHSGQSHRENTLQAVRFCSLLPMRAIPAEVIAMIGMQEDAYPRNAPALSLNLMHMHAKADYFPSQVDYDRFLFLETVLSARKYLLLSYQGRSDDGGKESLPSLLITELLNYLDQACTVAGEKPSKKCTYKHPQHPFDSSYYCEDSVLRSYSKHHFRLAQAFYHVDKREPIGFISTFNIAPVTDFTDHLDLKNLTAVARNPIKAYFNKTLGIYLDNTDKRKVKQEEDFDLSPLQSYILKRGAFNQSVNQIIHSADKEGLLPVGAFKKVAIDKLHNEIMLLRNNLESLGVSHHKIFSITCSEHVHQPIQSSLGHWQLPPLKMTYRNKSIHITGQLPEVSAQGLIAHAHDNKVDVIKFWPQFLFLNCLVKSYGLPIHPQLLMIKGKKGRARQPFFDNPDFLLERYVDYYFTALESASPLIPEWVPHVLTLPAEELATKIQESLTNPFSPFYNEEMKWVLQQGNVLPDSEVLMDQWQLTAKELYGDLYKNWYDV